MKWTLIPLKIKASNKGVERGNFEQILIRDDDDYPVCIVHSDIFWGGDTDVIYETLQDGESLVVEVEMKISIETFYKQS